VLVEGLEDVLGEINGQIGICEYCDFMSGCWTVVFEDKASHKIRPEYLTIQEPSLRPGAYVKLMNLSKAPHLNGTHGICDELDEETQRWGVCMENGDRKLLKPANLVPLDSYSVRREAMDSTEQQVSAAFEEALASGDINWIDC